MTSDRHDSLILIFIDQNIATEIEPEKVIEEFEVLIPRKGRPKLQNFKCNISNIRNKYKL